MSSSKKNLSNKKKPNETFSSPFKTKQELLDLTNEKKLSEAGELMNLANEKNFT
jgi:hypothetical protein